MRNYCESNGIVVTAHSVLGAPENPWSHVHPPKLLNDAVINRIASKHRTTASSVLIKWALQEKMVVLAKSVTNSRIKSNIEDINIELDSEDLKQIKMLDLDTEGRFNHPITPWLGRGFFTDDLKSYSNFKGILTAALTPMSEDT